MRGRGQVLDRVAGGADQEEVEDEHERQRHQGDADPPCDEPRAHSSVHSSGSVLLRPLAMNDEPTIASEIRTEPIRTERGVVSQPSSPLDATLATGPRRRRGSGPGLQRQDLLRGLEQRPARGRRRRLPAVPGVACG